MPQHQTSMFNFDELPPKEDAAKQSAASIKEGPTEAQTELVAFFFEPESILPKATASIPKSKKGRKKLTEADATVDLIEIPEDEILFQKKYYGIGKVAEMFKVNISLIRFWEKEFSILKPKLNGKGDRLFRPEDVKNLQLIHHLLREKKYTIQGANDFLKNNKTNEAVNEAIEELKKTKAFLLDLKMSL